MIHSESGPDRSGGQTTFAILILKPPLFPPKLLMDVFLILLLVLNRLQQVTQ